MAGTAIHGCINADRTFVTWMQDRFNIRIGAYDDDRDLSYGELMVSSKFALVAPGTCCTVCGSSSAPAELPAVLFTLMCTACAWLESLHLCPRLMPNHATGDGWASRLEDSLLHGTIPVIIQDGVAEKFHGVVDYAAISVRIAEADIERVRAALRSAGIRVEMHEKKMDENEILKSGFLCMIPPG
jgi:Exostosin family